MFLVDDMLLMPLRGLMWIAARVGQAAEQASLDVPSIHRELLATELAYEEGRLGQEEYELRQAEILARLRAAQQARRAAAGLPAGPPRGARLEVDADFGGYGPDAGKGGA